MSYILDALKKADAEREREGVPTLHTQHGDAPEPGAMAHHTSPRLPWLLGGLLGGALLVLGGWWALAPSDPAAVAQAPVPEAAPRPIPPAPAMVSAPTQAPTPAPAPAPTKAQVQPMVSPQPPAAVQAPERKAGHRANDDHALRVDASLRDAVPPVVPVSELPEEVRRELPALSVSGAMHSDVPANRMLILNGSVFHEGDQPAPGLVLEEIKLKSAVFRFKGRRYSVAY